MEIHWLRMIVNSVREYWWISLLLLSIIGETHVFVAGRRCSRCKGLRAYFAGRVVSKLPVFDRHTSVRFQCNRCGHQWEQTIDNAWYAGD